MPGAAIRAIRITVNTPLFTWVGWVSLETNSTVVWQSAGGIGVAQGGANGAEAPTPILEGAKPLHF